MLASSCVQRLDWAVSAIGITGHELHGRCARDFGDTRPILEQASGRKMKRSLGLNAGNAWRSDSVYQTVDFFTSMLDETGASGLHALVNSSLGKIRAQDVIPAASQQNDVPPSDTPSNPSTGQTQSPSATRTVSSATPQNVDRDVSLNPKKFAGNFFSDQKAIWTFPLK